ncbi:MAG: hypothetical protein K2G64_01235 [Muribaculaceae bacterium]|nr:hypothetical protein [Muribaculaceae bacterium]MDE5967702.1 hypothetical protein [Muribaculaceae bacterium]
MKLLNFLLFFVIVSLPLQVVADRNDNSTQHPTATTVLSQKRHTTTRPEAPSRVFIMCAYDSEHLYFQLPAGVIFITVDLIGETNQWSGVATAEFPRVDIPVLMGEYEINCTTDDGRVFSGFLSF